MKVYVASKYERRAEVREVVRRVRLQGHAVVGDWTHHSVDGEDPVDAAALLEAFAVEDADAVKCCDAFLLLHDDNCRGGFVELGAALATRRWTHTRPRVVVVGGRGKAPTLGPIFYLHPHVEHFDSVDEALGALGEAP